MTTEEKLKELILKKYYSIREFTTIIDMPYSTMDSIFKRGIGNSSVSNIIKICKELGISTDALADGEIRPIKAFTVINPKQKTEVSEILSDTKDYLIHSDKITMDGKVLSNSDLTSLFDAIDVGLEMTKKRKSNITKSITKTITKTDKLTKTPTRQSKTIESKNSLA